MDGQRLFLFTIIIIATININFLDNYWSKLPQRIFFLLQAKLQQLVLLRIPDVVTIARCPESGEETERLNLQNNNLFF